MPTIQAPRKRKRKASFSRAVPAERVREMLLEIAFVLHATRVVGRLDEGVAVEDEARKIAVESVK